MRDKESQNSQALTVNTLVVAMDIQHLATRETTLHSLMPRPSPQSHVHGGVLHEVT